MGQPNVIVGGLLFFVSVMTLGRAGVFGLSAWEGMAALITKVGAAIILVGHSFVGLVVFLILRLMLSIKLSKVGGEIAKWLYFWN